MQPGTEDGVLIRRTATCLLEEMVCRLNGRDRDVAVSRASQRRLEWRTILRGVDLRIQPTEDGEHRFGIL